MKKMPLIILIPALTVFLVIASVFAWQMGAKTVTTETSEQAMVAKTPPTLDDSTGAPASSFQKEADSASPVADLEAEISSTVDDGGASDFTSLDQASTGL